MTPASAQGKLNAPGLRKSPPLSDAQLLDVVRGQGLPKAGERFIRQAILEGPSRAVGGTGFLNVSSHYPSRATGTTRQSESATAERLFYLDREYELACPGTEGPKLLSYLDQCPPVVIEAYRADGKRYRCEYRADALLIREDKPTVYQREGSSGAGQTSS